MTFKNTFKEILKTTEVRRPSVRKGLRHVRCTIDGVLHLPSILIGLYVPHRQSKVLSNDGVYKNSEDLRISGKRARDRRVKGLVLRGGVKK